ncbi:glycoside hydrolase family 16 protein [Coniochaeta sp. 2T2.1]|nr:glycoside hydrolase family 16 protein [Coniochaeta sp. 2T2.1]
MASRRQTQSGTLYTAVVALLAISSLPSALAATAAYPLTTDSNCHCYKTNATSANYFGHHKFFDFRQLNQYVNVPGVKPDPDSNANAPPPSNYFQSAEWTSTWGIQNWNNSHVFELNNSDVTGSDASVLMVNSPNNIYIERNQDNQASSQTHLTMRTARLRDFQTAAEFESISQGYQYVSVRMFARTKGAPGAVTAMFTYRPGPNNSLALVQEADLEIRTVDPPNFVQYTNQPSWNSTGDIPQATRNATLPAGRRWSDWAYYRLDWTPGSSTWYVNGQLVSAISFQAPRDPALIMFNNWSDGGSWSGNMSVNSQAYLQIQWIEMVYNNTDPQFVKSGKCINVCTIDETSRIGVPALLTNVGQGTGGTQGGAGTAACAATAKKWDQCAGKNWNGCKVCPSGTTCKYQNDYYSQCL